MYGPAFENVDLVGWIRHANQLLLHANGTLGDVWELFAGQRRENSQLLENSSRMWERSQRCQIWCIQVMTCHKGSPLSCLLMYVWVRCVSWNRNRALAILGEVCVFIRCTYACTSSKLHVRQYSYYLHCCDGIQKLKLQSFQFILISHLPFLLRSIHRTQNLSWKLQTLFPIWLLGYGK